MSTPQLPERAAQTAWAVNGPLRQHCIVVEDAVAVSNPRSPGEAMAPCVNTAAA